MELDADALGHLRDVVRQLDQAASLAEVVQLSGDLTLRSGLTVDFTATRELGQPLVVLRPASPSDLARLTPREREIAALIADGLSNKEIAARIGLTVGTVKHYVHQILDKTG